MRERGPIGNVVGKKPGLASSKREIRRTDK